ncbi:MAG: hypothetical protein ABF295_10870 [Flavobacteriaceae bacterium]
MTTNSASVWNIFYRSIKTPGEFSVDFGKSTSQGYFWRLCGLYLCLPILIMLFIGFATGKLDGGDLGIIGVQVALLLPLLFLSIWLLEKLGRKVVDQMKKKSGGELYWLLASNYFFLIAAPLGIAVLMANLLPNRILNNSVFSLIIPLLFIGSIFLWLRSAVLLIRKQTESNLNKAILIAIGGAVALTVTAWFVIGILGILILLPIGLSV